MPVDHLENLKKKRKIENLIKMLIKCENKGRYVLWDAVQRIDCFNLILFIFLQKFFYRLIINTWEAYTVC